MIMYDLSCKFLDIEHNLLDTVCKSLFLALAYTFSCSVLQSLENSFNSLPEEFFLHLTGFFHPKYFIETALF